MVVNRSVCVYCVSNSLVLVYLGALNTESHKVGGEKREQMGIMFKFSRLTFCFAHLLFKYCSTYELEINA